MTTNILTRSLITDGIELCRLTDLEPTSVHVAYSIHLILSKSEGQTPLAMSLQSGYLNVYIQGELDALQAEKPRT